MDYKNCPYGDLFKKYARLFGLPWKLIKSQAWQESRFNPNALSPSGARGLLQLMPKTDLTIDGHIDAFDVEGNLKDGVQYDREQYDHLKEVPDICERLKFSLASYNGGRAYTSPFLADPHCVVDGKRPDHKQITDYVEKIWSVFIPDVFEMGV